MSERTDRLLLVIGSGPGIGNTTASLFAQKRFNKIALIARNATRLQDDKEGVEKAARDAGREVEVRTWSLDVSDIPKLKETLAETEKFGQIEAVFFNAARVIESPFFSHPESEIRYDFEITTIALYATAAWAYPQLKKLATEDSTAHPFILVTSSHLPGQPSAEIFALSLTKAAQHNMTRSLAQIGTPDGIHVAIVSPCGVVSPKYKYLNPSNIAQKAWDLYAEEKGHFTLETRVEE